MSSVYFLLEPIKTNDQLLGEELHCRTCLVSFSVIEDYRLHYRDDLHRYNLKLKLNGKPPVNQEEFCEIEDGISSLSGSDSEDDTSHKSVIGSPKVYFQNQAGQKMAVYRCLLHSKKVSNQFSHFCKGWNNRMFLFRVHQMMKNYLNSFLHYQS